MARYSCENLVTMRFSSPKRSRSRCAMRSSAAVKEKRRSSRLSAMDDRPILPTLPIETISPKGTGESSESRTLSQAMMSTSRRLAS